ncbi:putative glucuronosyltransferase PGSIP8 [Cucumis melo var. makuwa]|uniref:Putative glucuronosyltransferase PGSIP8 n=1 Tax=Cucumis melo var. makuwa TaxID=1194695 RepID=A0A5D3CJN5_CUCMM|nr:putative glucuronosyltransferase PGSIP8 [Cucumis melo var. makuwa]
MSFNGVLRISALLFVLVFATAVVEESVAEYTKMTTKTTKHRNAYASMMYMGTPRDYEFYVATRVLIRSLVKLNVDADLVVIASRDVPVRWVRALLCTTGTFPSLVSGFFSGRLGLDGRWTAAVRRPI